MSSYDSDLRDAGPGLLESIWRYKWLVVLVVLLGTAAGLLIALQQTPQYEASSRLLLADPRTAGLFGELRAGTADTNRYTRNQAEFIRTGAVYPQASELIDGSITPAQMERRVTVEVDEAADLLIITAWDFTPEGAAALADAVGEAYQIVVAEQVRAAARNAVDELEERNEALRTQLRVLAGAGPGEGTGPAAEAERSAALTQIAENESRIQQLIVDAELFRSGVDVFAPARVPPSPARPQPVRTAAAGMLLSFVVGAGFAWWRNSTSQVAEHSNDAAALLHAPLLGEVPDFRKVGLPGHLPSADAPLSPAAEAYQFVASSLMFALDQIGGKVVLVTSARPGDGKTVSVANLAVTARRDGRQVVLVDADKRVGGLTKLCHAETDAGLSDLQGASVPFEWVSARIELAEGVPITFVNTGADVEDPAGYFRTSGFRRAMGRVRERGDLVLVDTPPLLAVSDTSAIASQVDGIILVVDRGTPLQVLAEVRRRLEFIGTPLIGYVFNRARSRSSVYGYVGSEYAYGSDKKQETRRARRQVDPAFGLAGDAPVAVQTRSSSRPRSR